METLMVGCPQQKKSNLLPSVVKLNLKRIQMEDTIDDQKNVKQGQVLHAKASTYVPKLPKHQHLCPNNHKIKVHMISLNPSI